MGRVGVRLVTSQTRRNSQFSEKVAVIFSRIHPNIWRANRDNNSAVTVAMSPPVLLAVSSFSNDCESVYLRATLHNNLFVFRAAVSRTFNKRFIGRISLELCSSG